MSKLRLKFFNVKHLKIAVSIVTGLLLLLALLIVGIIFILPGAKDLKTQIGGYEKEKQNNSVEKKDSSTAVGSQVLNGEVPIVAEGAAQTPESMQKNPQEIILEEFINSHKPLIQFCENLASTESSSFWDKGTGTQFGQYMADHMLDEKKDPYLETILPALKYAMRGEQMSKLFELVKSADEGKEEGFFDKAEFYTQMAFAVNEVRARKEKTEQLVDRTYLLFTLANAVKKKPELINEAGTLDFCNRIQRSILEEGGDDIEAGKRSLDDFLHFAGLKNEDVDYDPNYKTSLQISSSNNSIQFSGGWIDKYIAEPAQEKGEDSP